MIYLDNAATSFPKPTCVIEEQTRCMRQYCGNPSRGSHALAMRAAQKIYDCRCEAAELFGVSNPEGVVFTMNTTMSINMLIKGLLRTGDHVLLSDMEHNSVYRPIYKLAREGRVSYDVFPTFPTDPARTATDICRAIRSLIKPNTRLLIAAHASNICSATLPITEIGRLCAEHGVLFVVDAAQSAGHISINMKESRIGALCVPGHKGLLGPQGCGLMLLSDGLHADTLMEGGSGFQSLSGEMPEEAPERYEAGTLPTPAIAGLCEGIRFVRSMGVAEIGAHAREMNQYLQERLLEIPKVTVYTPHHVGSVLLFNVDGMSSDEVGDALNRREICVRTGFHCSALGHATLGTTRLGGAVRVSTGYATTKKHMDALLRAVREL